MPAALQVLAQLLVIVDLAVEYDDHVAVFGHDRLVPAIQVQNFQARCTQRNSFRFEHSLLIRSAVEQRPHRLSNPAVRRAKALPRKPDYSAHVWILSSD